MSLNYTLTEQCITYFKTIFKIKRFLTIRFQTRIIERPQPNKEVEVDIRIRIDIIRLCIKFFQKTSIIPRYIDIFLSSPFRAHIIFYCRHQQIFPSHTCLNSLKRTFRNCTLCIHCHFKAQRIGKFQPTSHIALISRSIIHRIFFKTVLIQIDLTNRIIEHIQHFCINRSFGIIPELI